MCSGTGSYPDCRGEGQRDEEDRGFKECYTCYGSGECPDCDGTGQYDDPDND